MEEKHRRDLCCSARLFKDAKSWREMLKILNWSDGSDYKNSTCSGHWAMLAYERVEVEVSYEGISALACGKRIAV